MNLEMVLKVQMIDPNIPNFESEIMKKLRNSKIVQIVHSWRSEIKNSKDTVKEFILMEKCEGSSLEKYMPLGEFG